MPCRPDGEFSMCARGLEIPLHRILEVRRKIAEGFYDRPDVMLETARRMLEMGDIKPDE